MGLVGSKCISQSVQSAKSGRGGNEGRVKFRPIPDKFETIEEVQQALMNAGVESSQLILGVDFTKSNLWTGKRSFKGQSLHHVDRSNKRAMNPYQTVIKVLGRTLEAFDDDKLIPAYGFGDVVTANKAVFSFTQGDRPCSGFDEVLQRYDEIASTVHLAGPTNWAPIINRAIEIVSEEGSYHILVIIGDGQVTNAAETREAIVRASNYPISIVAIGVGDGPWDMMEEFDDELPTRKFDNFQFVELNKTLRQNPRNFDAAFALNALMEVPEQYDYIKRLGLLDGRGCPMPQRRSPPAPSPVGDIPVATASPRQDMHLAVAKPALQRQGSWSVQLNAMWNGPFTAVPLA